MGYFKDRMKALGYSKSPMIKPNDLSTKKDLVPMFRAIKQEDGLEDIEILYPTLGAGDNRTGHCWQTYQTRGGRSKPYARIRLHPEHVKQKDNKDGRKYDAPYGSGVHVFPNENVREAYRNKTNIEDLHIIEGEFKMSPIELKDMYWVGLGGKDMFKRRNDPFLHPDLINILQVTQPKRVFIHHDVDAVLPEFDKWKEDPNHDLGSRLWSFYSTLMRFNGLLKDYVPTVIYKHIKPEVYFEHEVKGNDDLLEKFRGNKDKTKSIVDELSETREGLWFYASDISVGAVERNMKAHFMLPTKKNTGPVEFYEKYQDILEGKEFVFNGSIYALDPETSELALRRPKEADDYLRIGTDYFKKIDLPDAEGNSFLRLHIWRKGEITQDFGRPFFDHIARYDAPVNIPANIRGQYQPVVNNCYNIYSQSPHIPEKGEWPSIEKVLKHLFEEHYHLIIDYLTVLWNQPMQKLPIVVLASKETGTGKSTFLWLLKELLVDNCAVIGNTEINDRFNGDYMGKLMVCLEEGLIEKRATVERLKSWVLAPKVSMDNKHQSRHEVDCFLHLALTTNNETNFAPLDTDDSRFWIRKVNKFTGDVDPDMREKMREEIPAFVYFLENREPTYEKKDRLWFHHEDLKTELWERTVQASGSWGKKAIYDWAYSKFFELYSPTFYAQIGEVKRGAEASSSKDWIQSNLKEILESDFNVEIPQKITRVRLPLSWEDRKGGGPHTTESKSGLYYRFDAKNILNKRDYKTFRDSLESLGVDPENYRKPVVADVWKKLEADADEKEDTEVEAAGASAGEFAEDLDDNSNPTDTELF